MTTIATIVEGDGEVAALPVLLRRVGEWLSPAAYCNILPPIRVHRDQFLNRENIFSKQIQLAALKCSHAGWLLILLDADHDCPNVLGSKILERVRAIAPHIRVSVVLPKFEYEAWFIAAAASIDGKRGFRNDNRQHDAEAIRGAKEWLSERIPSGRYREVLDQPSFSATIDLQLAHKNSRSFRKLCTEWEKNVGTLNAA